MKKKVPLNTGIMSSEFSIAQTAQKDPIENINNMILTNV